MISSDTVKLRGCAVKNQETCAWQVNFKQMTQDSVAVEGSFYFSGMNLFCDSFLSDLSVGELNQWGHSRDPSSIPRLGCCLHLFTLVLSQNAIPPR